MQVRLGWPLIAWLICKICRKDREAGVFILRILSGDICLITSIIYLIGTDETRIYYSTMTRISSVAVSMAAGLL